MGLGQRFRDQPITRKVMLLMMFSSGAALTLTAVALFGYAWYSARSSAAQDLATLAQIVADNTSAAMVFGDPAAAAGTLNALRAKPEIELACLYRASGNEPPKLFANYSRAGACPAQPPPLEQTSQLQAIAVTVPVTLANDRIGVLHLVQSLQKLREALPAQAAILLGIIGASFGLSLALALAMQRVVSKPILDLASTARRISDTRDYSLRPAPAASRDEVGRLIDDFNQMLGQIALRDEEIRQTRDALYQQVREKTQFNEELQSALQRLKEAQAQLVQSEKLASLGALVAGIAHEINTPVGVSVTAASTLQAGAGRLKEQYASQSLKRSELENFVSLAEESTRILLKNLQRAADLIQSFKQVAVDQSSGECRRFNLKAYIDEVLLSLAPKLKNTAHEVSVDCRDNLVIETYPGAIAQIITNFVSNSLLHGYDPGERGHIHIGVVADAGWVTLRYTDDGHGMPKEHLARIFDPFFTTRRGTGGSGLGMHIVYNLATQALSGTIQAASQEGKGVEFVLRFPADSRRAIA
jgi:signal transduction histidine kinase